MPSNAMLEISTKFSADTINMTAQVIFLLESGMHTHKATDYPTPASSTVGVGNEEIVPLLNDLVRGMNECMRYFNKKSQDKKDCKVTYTCP